MNNFQSTIKVEMPDLREYADEQVAQFVKEVTFGIEREAKEAIQAPGRSGRTYRRAKITRAASKKLVDMGFRTYDTAKGNKRAVVGYEFHRASAKGEAPASDSGTLGNRIRGRMLTNYSGEVEFGTEYAELLEFWMNRSYIQPAIERAVDKAMPILN